jgi:hypothetical protein
METFISQIVLSKVLFPADGRPIMATVAHFIVGGSSKDEYTVHSLLCLHGHLLGNVPFQGPSYPDFDSINPQKSLQLIEKQAFISPFQNTNMFI